MRGDTMDQSEAFIHAILESPEDAPRLVYADWLDDNGDPDRAEFIRAQVAQDRIAREVPYLDDWHGEALREVLFDAGDWGREWVDYLWEQRRLARLLDERAPTYFDHQRTAEGLLAGPGKGWARAVE